MICVQLYLYMSMPSREGVPLGVLPSCGKSGSSRPWHHSARQIEHPHTIPDTSVPSVSGKGTYLGLDWLVDRAV